ncbi:MAG: hypothetical protein Q7S71_04875 [Candidatus Nitrotoga sp.]|nr:hypothetical protein [Candidatus Nitrotoga sp.]
MTNFKSAPKQKIGIKARITRECLSDLICHRALAGLFVGLLFAPTHWAQASDDLLDPGKIGAAHKSVATETPTRHHSANHRAPSYARGMAESVTSSLDSLTHAAADLVDEVIKLDNDAHDLANKLQTLQEEMDRKMGEYRSGLFCSGCNQTKSEILAKRETFPHPGQTIIRPTQAQIDAKERELQAPIDKTDHELRANRTRRAKAVNEREEAFLQIGYGLNLWRTSITFEDALIWLDEKDSVAAYKVVRSKTEDQIGKLRIEMQNTKDKNDAKLTELAFERNKWADKLIQLTAGVAALKADGTKVEEQLEKLRVEIENTKDQIKFAELVREREKRTAKLNQLIESAAANKTERVKCEAQLEKLRVEIEQTKDKGKIKLADLTRESEMWAATLDRLDQQRTTDKRTHQNELLRAATRVSNEQTTLDGYLRRGKLPQVLSATVSASFIIAGVGFNELGGKYRMGRYNFAGHDEVLQSVTSFIDAFRNSAPNNVEIARSRNGVLPAQNVPLIPQLKGKLRELLKCDPDAGEKCAPPSKNVGPIRG